jgi:hypothetical protein
MFHTNITFLVEHRISPGFFFLWVLTEIVISVNTAESCAYDPGVESRILLYLVGFLRDYLCAQGKGRYEIICILLSKFTFNVNVILSKQPNYEL